MTNEDIAAFHAALTRLVTAYQFRDRDRVSAYGVTITQCYALAAVVARGPLTINGLAAALSLNKSTASRVAEALEGMGLVERRANPASGKSVLLRATRSGRALHGRIERELIRQEADILADYPHRVRAAATTLLHQLADRVEARESSGQCNGGNAA